MMLAGGTGREWQRWAETEAYFGVLTDEKFLNANLNESSREEFFASGEEHVDHVFATIQEKVRAEFQPVRALDYGCGVGRLVIPLARRCGEVVGVDISQGMLEEARKNCARFGIDSARMVHIDELDSLPPGSLDLVHSYIVFQHIPVAQGEAVLRKLILLLGDGGVGAIQFTFLDTRSAVRRGISFVRWRVGLFHRVMNLLQGKKFSTPPMEMNAYSMSRVFDLLTEMGCSNVHSEFWEHKDFHGAMLYFERQGGPPLGVR
jgi:ubiquinone/menaquinone biosynthesis C-methylase UbiE